MRIAGAGVAEGAGIEEANRAGERGKISPARVANDVENTLSEIVYPPP